VNVDFADVRTVMTYMGRAVMGMGVSRGPNRALEAAQKSISSPLLEEGNVQGARGVLLNITGGPSLSLHEVDEASSIIKEAADPDANIIVGQVINPDLGDELIITVVATGFDREEAPSVAPVVEQPKIKPVRTGQPAFAAARLSATEASPQNLERPAFLRRMNGQAEAQERLGLALDDEWDVPTFLRKQVD